MNIDRLNEFEGFVSKDVASAATELSKLADKDRKHLQRLVFTNLVDRFDSMVDHALLDNASEEPLLSEALNKLQDPISEGDLLRMLIKSEAKHRINERSRELIRNDILRNRHSKKLQKLFEVFSPKENTVSIPRVNISTGKIGVKYKPRKGNRIPTSICGYADWLYSRRNSVVHGAGATKLLKNDLKQMEAIYKAKPTATVKLSVGSISIASEFYQHITALLKSNH